MAEETKEQNSKEEENEKEPLPVEETPVEEPAPAQSGKEDNKKDKKAEKKWKAELEAAKAEGEKLKAQLAEEKDRYLRMAAEYDNYRRRTAKEKDGIYTDAVSDVIGQILPVVDNLERAALYQDAEKVAEGLALTAKSAKAMLAHFGVEEYGKEGETFDPSLHNAVMHEEDESVGENVITQVFQSGYRKGDKIVRFAMVKVAN